MHANLFAEDLNNPLNPIATKGPLPCVKTHLPFFLATACLWHADFYPLPSIY